MADLPISGLPFATLPLDGDEPTAIVQAGETRQVPASALGAWQLISTVEANADATIDFDNTLNDADHTHYALVIDELVNSLGANIGLRLGTGLVPTYQTTFYQYYSASQGSTGAVDIATTINDNFIKINGSTGIGTTANRGKSWVIFLSSIDTGGEFYWTGAGYISSGALASYNGAGSRPGTIDITSVQVLTSNGTITSGIFSLYSIKRT